MRYELAAIWRSAKMAKNCRKFSTILATFMKQQKNLKLALDSFQILVLLDRQEWIFHSHQKLHLRLNRTKISRYLFYHFEPKNWLKRLNRKMKVYGLLKPKLRLYKLNSRLISNVYGLWAKAYDSFRFRIRPCILAPGAVEKMYLNTFAFYFTSIERNKIRPIEHMIEITFLSRTDCITTINARPYTWCNNITKTIASVLLISVERTTWLWKNIRSPNHGPDKIKSGQIIRTSYQNPDQ